MKRPAVITIIAVVQAVVIAGLLCRGESIEGFGMGLVLGLVLGALVGAAFRFREQPAS